MDASTGQTENSQTENSQTGESPNGSSANSARAKTGSSMIDNSSIQEHGRTYHSYKEGTYLLPNDGEEQDRLDLQHTTLFRLMGHELYWAPITQPKSVLDIGTGTGIWAIEFAREHPNANVIGTDLSLIQPSNIVSNVSFAKEDAEDDEWLHPSKFDFIHLRLLFTCFTDFDKVLRNIYNNLEPGGWVEFQDHTAEVFVESGEPCNSALSEWCNGFATGLAKIGRNAMRMNTLVERLRLHGFVDCTEHVLAYPVGGWPNDERLRNVGNFAAVNVARGLNATIKLLLAGGMTADQSNALIERVRDELTEGKTHQYLPFHITYARRPLE